MKTIRAYLKDNWRFMGASFFLPVFIMVIIYLSLGIYPGSSRSVLASDAFSQFSNFHASFNNVLHGDQSLFYSWNASLGLNYLSLISYYLGGLFTPLVFFFDNQYMPDALYFLTLLKIGAAGLSCWFFAKHTYKLPNLGYLLLSVPYALMSFITAHSEIIMWLDAFVYLPLITLGIHRLMDQRKPTLLFVSYLLLFLSNFYMGFMVAIFSALYYLARLLTDFKTYRASFFSYTLTSLLASGASMIIILPAIIDLKTNGETLSSITKWKTEATGFWDIVMKNMIGIYDTTKYGSIPFIYVGLLPLLFCVFYFICPKIKVKNKLLYGGLFAILIASFYLTPLNLFWHGMHSPNMFLFRYSFLFSFLVIVLAGYGLEKFKRDDLGLFMGGSLLVIALFALAMGTTSAEAYDYISLSDFVLTLTFFGLYLAAIAFYQLKKIPRRYLFRCLTILVVFEALLNTSGMLNGILSDWNYASRSLYTTPYPAIEELVDQTKAMNESFYRLENLDPVSANDGLNYGYNGISQFSSIRNRHSSSYLNDLGFRSRGTNLNIRYANNTLLMDTFTGIKYNLAEQDPLKYGFESIAQSGVYQLYENHNALPLGMLANATIYDVAQPANDNLGTQTALFNELAQTQLTYFQFYQPNLVAQNNVRITQDETGVTYKETTSNVAKELTWTVDVPARTQAYLSLFPTDFGQLESSTATVTVNGSSQKSQINITGQYYNLGWYEEATTVTFSVSFYGTEEVSFINPKVVGLDLDAFDTAVEKISANGVDFTVAGRKATAQVTTEKEQVLLTTIAYDKGWTAYVDGEKVPVKAFKKALVSFTVPEGTHEIKLVYCPPGFKLGAALFVACLALFIGYRWWLQKQQVQQINATSDADSIR